VRIIAIQGPAIAETQKDISTPDGGWVRDCTIFTDVTEAGVQTKYTKLAPD
jgi:hypothetical protein